jgi:hypothetical protein
MTKKLVLGLEEEGDSATNVADCLGLKDRLNHHKLTKEYLASPSVSMPKKITGKIKNGEDIP